MTSFAKRSLLPAVFAATALFAAARLSPLLDEETGDMANPYAKTGVWKVEGDLCVAPRGDSTTDGAVMELARCSASAAQKITWDPKTMTMRVQDKCMGIEHGWAHEDAKITLSECNGGTHQKFNLWAGTNRNAIRVMRTNMCLDVFRGQFEEGHLLSLHLCHDGREQRFTFTPADEGRTERRPSGALHAAARSDGSMLGAK